MITRTLAWQRLSALLPLLFLAPCLVAPAQAQTSAPVQRLRCEYLSNPQGLDVQNPRLSWTLNAAAGVRGQQAYRVLVAGSPATLQKDQGDLWDSGRVASSQNTWIEYAGKPLVSGQRAYWKVRVWADTGARSKTSGPDVRGLRGPRRRCSRRWRG